MLEAIKIRNSTKIFLGAVILLFIVFILIEFAFLIALLFGVFVSVSLGFLNGLNGLIEKIVISPLTWGAFTLATIFIILTPGAAKTNVKAILFNISFVFFAIGMFEVFMNKKVQQNTASHYPVVNVKMPEKYYRRDDTLGYGPVKGICAPAISTYNEEILYHVKYTIDSNGQRITPPFIKSNDSRSILFFGCSVTFGYGLNDESTFPYIAGMKLKDKYKVYNFGFEGYGTHQMLAALTQKVVDKVVDIKPQYAIYSAIPDHIDRLTNKKSWGSHDPKFTMEDGQLVYEGHFDDNGSSRILSKLKESFIFRKFFESQSADDDVELFSAMVDKSRHEINSKYPGCKFIVIFWDDLSQKELSDKMLHTLQRKNIEVHLISRILPDYNEQWSKYQIRPPLESHPNQLANQFIAEYIVKDIIKD
jgi:hypothetical protein